MKYGILGDIHANLSALDTVLQALQRDGADVIVSVGDVVGYGAAPKECIARLREIGAHVVLGNHDAASIGRLDMIYFNQYAKEAVLWTQRVLSKSDKDWLAALPLTRNLDHCSVAHGTLHHPELFDYIQTTDDADPSLDIMPLPVCFVGHSHVPVTLLRLRDEPERTAYTPDPEIELGDVLRALVNVGSVGQPRDEDPRTAYALFDTELNRVEIKRLVYDIDREAARIRAAGLPRMLADRLYLGV